MRADATAKDLRSASERDFAENAGLLLASLILADGTLNENEVLLARKACDEFGIPGDIFDRMLGIASADPPGSFAKALLRIESPPDRERLASILFEIASVDENLDRREAQLLEAMRRNWGVAVAFFNKPIEWDADQERIIEAPGSRRMLVSAGPGMGKTAVACSRVAHLVEKQDVSDGNIWLVSFTRAAIAELKGRIGDFAEDPGNVFAVKISTIDSQAWKIRYGFSPEEVERLFGGFETGIDAALSLIDARSDDFEDIFGALEHIIIDEAQDITGERARFLLRLIELLPKSCGITVFHDPAQAIYDYAADDEAPFRFTDALRTLLGSTLHDESLKRIYRTEERSLLKLYEDLRLDILGNSDTGSEAFKAKAAMVKDAAKSVQKGNFDGDALKGYDDALVLFRKRIEVSQASAFMASSGIAHRLRMSGLPHMPLPWLALVFGSTEGRSLSRAEFVDRCISARDTFPAELYGDDIESNAPEARWERLRRLAPAGKDIDLFKLRDRLAGAPPDEFMAPEFGHRGPILGTIHASKGREADHVFLQINDGWGSQGRNRKADFSEEARVLFVGATRARRSLAVQGGFAMSSACKTDGGRSYRHCPSFQHKNRYQFQLGLKGDFDPLSAGRLKPGLDELAKRPLPIRCSAHLEEGSWVYRIRTEDGRPVGSLTNRVNNDLFEIAKRESRPLRRTTDRILNLFIMGFGTMILPPGESGISGLRPDAQASGFWLVPQIVGLPLVFI
ncbi:MAG: AAA family ATPase [Sphingopyxis sp.]|nr:AAA family ATPase [Sphingopyxis sp.]